MTGGTIGSLAAGAWDWGDNDTLGFNTVYVRLTDGVDPDTKTTGYLSAAYTGIVTAGVGYLLFSFALHHVRPATAVTLALTEPVVAFVLAVLLLGEPASAAGVGGLALVVAGVLGVVRSELAAPRAPSN